MPATQASLLCAAAPVSGLCPSGSLLHAPCSSLSMSRFAFALALLIAALAYAPAASAQNDFLPTGPAADGTDNENQRFRAVPDIPGAYEYAYWARLGRTYFLELSTDLATWEYLPIIETGRGSAASYGFTNESPRVFVRLRHIAGTYDDPYALDIDADGLSNQEEFSRHSSPFLVDTDGDGIGDKTELGLLILNPDDQWWWGYLQPNKTDSDGNGIPDQLEDYDLDGLTIAQELARGTDPNKTDTDTDGVSDGKEVGLGTDPLQNDHFADHDSDNDGLNDLEEIIHGTDRHDSDTNGNGMPDGQEFDAGGDPVQPGPPPPLPDPDRPISSGPSIPPPPAPPTPPNPPAFSPAGHRVLIRVASAEHVKYGFDTYQVLNPPKRYLIETLKQHFSGGCPESGPVKTSGTKVTEIDPDDGSSAVSGDTYVTGGGDVQSPTVRRGVVDLDGYDDPPNDYADCTGPLAVSSKLTEENTTKKLKVRTKGKLPPYPKEPPPNDGFADGTPHAYRILSADELGYSYQRMQVKLAWPPNTPEEARHAITYLVIFEPIDKPSTPDIDESAHPEILAAWTWNGEGEQSEVWDLDPDLLNSDELSGHFYLQPLVLEIVNKDKQPVTELKVAKMSEPGVLSGTGASTLLNIDLDPDRFHVRLPGAARLGDVAIKVGTSDNPDSAYDDDPSPLQLHPEGSDLISHAQLLVSDKLDDEHPADGVDDEALNDRTHKIQLGGKFRVTAVTTLALGDIPVDFQATVPIRSAYTCNIFVLKIYAFGGWVPCTDVENPFAVPLERFRIAQERWAQAGVKLVLGRLEIVQPTLDIGQRYDRLNLLDVESGTVQADAKRIIDTWGTSGTAEIDIFFLALVDLGAVQGRALFSAALASSDTAYANTAFMAALTPNRTALAHEIGHLLTNRAHFGESGALNYQSGASVDDKNRNLMSNALQPDVWGFGGSRRITHEQQTFIP